MHACRSTLEDPTTSIAAFVDYFKWGLEDEPVQLLGVGDFEREFGGLDANSEASYSIQQFFLNGGAEAWAVRVTGPGAAKAAVDIGATINAGSAAMTVSAISKGTWGGDGATSPGLRVRIDPSTTVAKQFHMTISLHRSVNGEDKIVRQEIYRELSINSADANYVGKVLTDKISGSSLITVSTAGSNPPLANGSFSGTLSGSISITAASPEVDVTISDAGGGSPTTATAHITGLTTGSFSISDVAIALEAAIRAAKPDDVRFAGATVTVSGTSLSIFAGPSAPSTRIRFAVSAADALTFGELKLSANANAREYQLGITAAVTDTAQIGGVAGVDGSLPGATELVGSPGAKTGIYALEKMDLFNILAIPRSAIVSGSGALTSTQAQTVISKAEEYCASRRAIFVVDTPNNVTTPQQIKAWLGNNNGLRSKNSALYYPRVEIPDPLNQFMLRSVGPSGTIAGLFSRTDAARGVWKAPAGTEASLRNVSQLDYTMTDPENGTLNPLAINCIRNFPIYGPVSWGARTLDGSDQQSSEWKYVPVRRLALFLEESLYRGTKWVVFEPNDEPLWAQIRLNLTGFMQSLFRKGAFQGQTPREAYFVKCDKETTTQDDIDRGVVNIAVGFAPLKPAEFVVIQIQQIAGQISA